MKPTRLVLVSPRFWPLIGGAEIMMGRLAAEFQAYGIAATLLTARWNPDWPSTIEHHGIRVVRLDRPRRRFLGPLRYMTALGAWLEAHRGQYDLVLVSTLGYDAHVAIRAGRRVGVPVVLRAEKAGATGDVLRPARHSLGPILRRRCRQAAALIAPSAAIGDELLAEDYPADKVVTIPNGVPLPEPRTPEAQAEARRTLAAADPALRLLPGDRLTVFAGQLSPGKGLDVLIEAWSQLSLERPHEKLWLVGEGTEFDRLAARIEARGLAGQVVLTGAFDSIDDVLLAADCFVFPSTCDYSSVALLEAMAAELPVVTSDLPSNRQLVEHNRCGLLTGPGDSETLAFAIGALGRDPSLATRLGAAARRRVEERFTLRQSAQSHLELFSRLLRGFR